MTPAPDRTRDLRPGARPVPLGPTAWRHAGSALALAPSHDGATVAGGGEDLCLWRADDGALLRRLQWPLERFVRALCWSADDALLAVAGGGRVDLWSVGESGRRGSFAGHARALIEDGNGFLGASERGRALRVWRLRPDGREEEVAALEASVEGAALSPDGRWLAVARGADSPGLVELYELPSLRLARSLQGAKEFTYEEPGHDFWGEPCVDTHVVKASPSALAFTPDGASLLSGGNEPVARRWDVATGELRATVALNHRDATAFAFPPDGRSVVVVHGSLLERRGPLKRWSLDDDALVPLGWAALSAAFTRDGARLLLGDHTQRVTVVGAAQGEPLNDPADPGDAPSELAATRDGRHLLVRTGTRLYRCDPADGAVAWSLPMSGGSYDPVAATPGGERLVTTDLTPEGFGLQIIDARHGAPLGRMAPRPTLTWSLDVSPDGAWLGAANYRPDVDLWDLQGRAVRATLVAEAPHAVRFTAEGHGAVVAEKSGALRVYAWEGDPAGAIAARRTLTPTTAATPNAPNDTAHHLALSRDGRRALSGYNDVVRLWDLDAGADVLASTTSTRFAKVLAVRFDAGDQPQALIAAPSEGEGGAKGCAVTLWALDGAATVVWSPSELFLYRAKAVFLEGDRFALTGDDGVVRVHAVAAG